MEPKHYKEEIAEKLLIAKFYFDKGYGLTNYGFKLIAVFGLTSQLVKETFIVLFLYTFGCYFLGRIWANHGLIDIETEIGNRFNPFVSDVRAHMKKRKI